ncbi:hypothetical protein PtB15_15B267 [Puccinia triticina]|nr:hypothetical protein PtB15_15B267 [Puccinia triticina]
MSTRRTTSSDQLHPPTDTEALLRAANKAKQTAAAAARAAKSAELVETAASREASSSRTQPIPAPHHLETNSCPASLSVSLTLPPAIGFPNSPATSFFLADSDIPPVVKAWSPIGPESIRPPPPPPGPFNPLLSTLPALPPPAKVADTRSPPDPSTNRSASSIPPTPTALEKMSANAGDNPVEETPPGAPTQNLSTGVDALGLIAEMQCMSLQIQQASLDAQRAAERRAVAAQEAADERAKVDAEQLARMEEAFIRSSAKREWSQTPATAPKDDHVDLRRFRTSDGPAYTGPFQETEPFLSWINSLQIFFDTKTISLDDNKIKITGTLIKETNLLSFYSNEAKNYLGRPWKDFKEALFETAIPVRWRHSLKTKIRGLKMENTETFTQFEMRARTLQRMVNFDCKSPVISDLSLAEWMTIGLPEELQGDVQKFELLKAEPFKYNRFAKRVRTFYEALPKRLPPSNRGKPLNSQANATTQASSDGKPTGRMSDELRWRIHSYLDLLGRCHWCREHCGSPNGAFLAPRDKNRVNVPDSWVTPVKPSNYSTPQAWSSSKGPSNRPPNTSAGRATSRPAGVASVSDDQDDLYPEMEKAATAAIDELDSAIAQGYGEDEDLITEETEAAAVQHFDNMQTSFASSLSSLIDSTILGQDAGADNETSD